jgi:hypothetical protein
METVNLSILSTENQETGKKHLKNPKKSAPEKNP